MIPTNPCSRTLLAVLMLLVMSVRPSGAQTIEWRRSESAAWIAIAPERTTPRHSLEAVDAEGTSTPLPGRWMVLAPADTLHFAVRGEGTLRVQTRALFDSSAKSRRYRLGVLTAPGNWRHLTRHSAFETDVQWAGSTTVQRAAEVDGWETPLVSGAEAIAVTLREQSSAPVLVRVLVRGEIERPWTAPSQSASAAPKSLRWKRNLEVSAARAGYDGNAYYTPSDIADTTEVRDAWYWPLAIAASVELEDELPFDVALSYDFSTQQYDDAVLDEVRHRITLRETWSRLGLGPFGSGRLRLQQHLRTKNDTFFGRGDNEEFETGSGLVPGARVGLGDRFDWREFGVAAELTTRPSRAWRVELETFWLRRDHAEDFADEPEIYSLDQDRVGTNVTVRREFGPRWEFSARAGGQWWNYEEKFARDASGVELPTVATRLRRWPLELALEHRPGRTLRFDLALGTLVTTDLRDGYWDRSTLIASGAAQWDPRGPWSVGLRARHSTTAYDRARLDFASVGPLREKDSWRLRVNAEFRASERWDAFGSLAYTNLDNNSRTFAYERSVFETGVRAKF